MLLKFNFKSRAILGAYNNFTSISDEKIRKITFLIDNVNEEQRKFFRHHFLSDKKVRELDQKTANEILVTSTPSQVLSPINLSKTLLKYSYDN